MPRTDVRELGSVIGKRLSLTAMVLLLSGKIPEEKYARGKNAWATDFDCFVTAKLLTGIL